MVGKIEKRKLLQKEEFERRRGASSDQGRSKEELLAQRREMMRPQKKPGSEGDSPESPHS